MLWISCMFCMFSRPGELSNLHFMFAIQTTFDFNQEMYVIGSMELFIRMLHILSKLKLKLKNFNKKSEREKMVTITDQHTIYVMARGLSEAQTQTAIKAMMESS